MSLIPSCGLQPATGKQPVKPQPDCEGLHAPVVTFLTSACEVMLQPAACWNTEGKKALVLYA